MKAIFRSTMLITLALIAIFLGCSEEKKIATRVTGVTLNKTAIVLIQGQKTALVATVSPKDAVYKAVTWKSSNTAVATVTNNGWVTAVKKGTATITVTTKDGNKTASCKVTVKAKVVKVTGVKLNKTAITKTVGETEQLKATVLPANATNKAVTWSSSDKAIATVSKKGLVTAVKKGTATITVTTKDGNKTASCKVTVKAKVVKVTGVKLNKKAVTKTVGETEQLKATVLPANATNKAVIWSSSDKAIATVNSKGLVTAVKKGTATITVTTKDGNKTASCKVTVKAKVVKVTGVKLNKTAITKTVGETEQLKATVLPANATNKAVTWSSSNKAIATVNSKGLVTAVKKGTATITVTTKDGNKTASCKVTVKAKVVKVTGVKLNKTAITKTVGTTEQLKATVLPANATNKAVTWSSSNKAIATVNSKGLVTAKKKGKATITVTTKDGNKKATCTVTVTKKVIKVTGVKLNKKAVTKTVGETEQLKATVLPANATNKAVTWSSSNKAIATVNSKGLVTAKKKGKATITVTTKDGNKKATCTVTVKAKVVKVTGVKLNKKAVTKTVGETEQLKATVLPANATNKAVTWSSSNTAVATVSNKGLVTAKKKGKATITVTTKDGNKKATCTVTVKAKVIHVTQVKLNYDATLIYKGESLQLVATVLPKNATDKTVTWSSSNKAIATVNSKGLVTAKKKGKATITVKSNDGGKTATCKITVEVKVVKVTDVKLDKPAISKVEGSTEQLTATVLPANATNKNVTWSSSNTTIATVSNKGLVTAKKVGKATITVTTEDGNKTATCDVTVTKKIIKVTDVNLDKTTINTEVGSTEQLTATVLPANATNKNVTWSSSNTAVATVDNTGLVTAKKVGKATITVTTDDGGKKATCTITVSKASKITVTTAKAIGETIKLTIYAKEADRPNVWIDLNNNGTKDTGEKVKAFWYEDYTLQSQTFTIYGKVTRFRCDKSKITQLNVTENKYLQKLLCYQNQLMQLDISKNTALTYLECYSNQLTQLDVTKNTKLTLLYCGDNQLKQLDISKNTKLEALGFFKTKIKQLDISKHTELVTLLCSDTQIKQLDVSANTKLNWLVSDRNPELTKINAANGNNQNFTEFKATNCPKLTCIKVDKGFNPPSSWYKDDTASWRNDGSECP